MNDRLARLRRSLFLGSALLAAPATLSSLAISSLAISSLATAQEAKTAAKGEADVAGAAARGSIVEDRAAKKLLEAGDARLEADEASKAIEIWKSVIERYPKSRLRFDAHLRLGNYYLDRDRSYDRARTHFEQVAVEDNRDDDQRATATLKMGICSYHARNYGKCFQVMRDVIEKFPVSAEVNEAYYYIGLGHFQLAHYSRAIAALERVGTTLSGDDSQTVKLEAGKRFFVKIEDADLAVLEPGQAVRVRCRVSSGDEETCDCFPVGRNVRLVLGSIPTQLGKAKPGNGTLEVRGGDKVEVTYVDEHTADKTLNKSVDREVQVVGNALVAVTDGAFSETLRGVVLGKTVNVRVTDADRDVSDEADKIVAAVEIYRQKTDQELEAETAAAVSKGQDVATDEAGQPKLDKFKLIDRVEVTLVEAPLTDAVAAARAAQSGAAPAPATGPASGDATSGTTAAGAPATANPSPASPKPANGAAVTPAATAPTTAAPAAGTPAAVAPAGAGNTAVANGVAAPEDNSLHSGVFQASVSLVKADMVVAGDDTLQSLPGDELRVVYLDEVHVRDGSRQVQAVARCLEGHIGGVRVTRAVISDQELRIQTQLKTADALTNIGNRYKEFGLRDKSNEKYEQALAVCEEIMEEARKLGGGLLEQTYVQLWRIYFERDQLDLAAAMCQRLQNEFPNSGFVDDALLQLGDVARKQGNLNRAIGIFTRIANMPKSQLRGDAQFGIAECYEQLATEATAAAATQMQDRAFQEYKKVYDQFPDSGRVGEAVAKMANYYYQQKDFSRAIDTFETVLNDHPDAKFLDVILFNYGRCLYRMDRRGEAKRRFDQLIGDFPESPLAADAKKISEALSKAAAESP
jgi:TolA-binding protein